MFNKCALSVWCVLAVAMTVKVDARKLPSYITVCKKNDPHMDDCILKAVESIRPKLIEGIPELNVPALEPLHVAEVVFALKNQGFSAVARNVLIHGASKYKVTKNMADIKTHTFDVRFVLQKLGFEADYEANLRLAGIPIVGKGPLKANTTGLSCEAILHGKRVTNKKGVEVLTFPNVDFKVNITDFHIRIDKLFPDKALNDVTNDVINANSREILRSFQPILEQTVANVILDIANKVTEDIPYSEMFPEE